MAEELVLEQGFRDGRAVDGDEGALRPRRELMDGTGEQLLAGAALPQDEHGGVGRRHALDLEQRLLESFARAHEPRQGHALLQLLLEEKRAPLEPAPIQGAVHQDQEVIGVDRLGQKVGSPLANGAHRILDRAKRGHDDHVGLRPGLQRGGKHVEAAAGRELQIGEDHAEGGPGERAFGLVGVGAGLNRKPAGLQGPGQRVAKRLLVFDEKHVNHDALEGDGAGELSKPARGHAAPARLILEVRQGFLRGDDGGLLAFDLLVHREDASVALLQAHGVLSIRG